MATIKPWPTITQMQDAVAYVQAEYTDAVKYCPGTVPLYGNALSLAQSYLALNDNTAAALAGVKSLLDTARIAWYSTYGCKKPGSTAVTAAPPDDNTTVGGAGSGGPSMTAGGGDWIWWAVGLGGLLAIYFLTKKK